MLNFNPAKDATMSVMRLPGCSASILARDRRVTAATSLYSCLPGQASMNWCFRYLHHATAQRRDQARHGVHEGAPCSCFACSDCCSRACAEDQGQ